MHFRLVNPQSSHRKKQTNGLRALTRTIYVRPYCLLFRLQCSHCESCGNLCWVLGVGTPVTCEAATAVSYAYSQSAKPWHIQPERGGGGSKCVGADNISIACDVETGDRRWQLYVACASTESNNSAPLRRHYIARRCDSDSAAKRPSIRRFCCRCIVCVTQNLARRQQ